MATVVRARGRVAGRGHTVAAWLLAVALVPMDSAGQSTASPLRSAALSATSAGLPRIGVSDTLFYFEAERFGLAPAAQLLLVFNDYDAGTLDWAIHTDRSWLAASPDRGLRNEAEIQIWIANTNSVIGPHTGHVVITSSSAANSPETVWVNYEVLCPIRLTGDVNRDGTLSQSDIIYLVNHLLRAGPGPQPLAEAGDVNCDGTLALGDVIYLVNHVLRAGPSPCNACSLL